MSKITRKNPNRLYFSERLQKKLNAIPDYPITTVTAPAGYGKTTAINSFCESASKEFRIIMLKVIDDNRSAVWNSLVDDIEKTSPELASMLRMMKLPEDAMERSSFKSLIKSFMDTHKRKYIWVIDDYHNIKNERVIELVDYSINAFLDCVRFVIISRSRILSKKKRVMLEGRVNAVTADDLKFTTDDIIGYYSLCGIHISAREAEKLEEMSQGWISILYLNMKSYADTGRFTSMVSINRMMGEIMCEPLTEKHKRVISVLSIVPEFTLEQAVYVCGMEDADSVLLEMMEDNAFIEYNPVRQCYSLHNLLNDCLTKGFDSIGDEERKQYILRAGKWELEHADYYSAMRRFYSVRAFDDLMTAVELDQGASLTNENKNEFVKWLDESPRKYWTRHPLAMLVFARRLVTLDMRKKCSEMLDEVLYTLSADDSIPDSEKKNLIGEIEIVESLLSYNNLRAMTVHLREANELMDRPTYTVDPKAPWGNGSPSILFCYSRVSGRLDEELTVLKEYMHLWYKLAQDQGRGTEHIMEGEIFFQRGDMQNARKCMAKAIEDAEKYDQVCILVCAHFLSMRIELFEGDYEQIEEHLDMMRQLISDSKQRILRRTVDLCEGWVYSVLRQTDRFPEWIGKGQYEISSMLHPAETALHLVHCKTLLVKGEYDELLRIENAEFEMADYYPTLQYRIYLSIIYAIVYDSKNKHKNAMSHLDKALRLALPDRVYMPFAETGAALSHLMREMPRKYDEERLQELLSLMEQYSINRRKMIKSNFSKTPEYDLSKRELEIAELAAENVSNREIAEKLGISENTVKSSLRIVFKKLNIGDDVRNKRRELDNYFK